MTEFEDKVMKKLDMIIALLKEKSKTMSKPNSVIYSIANKPCKICNGLISWDEFDKAYPTPPIHVDEKGIKIGDGSCPEYEP